MPHNVTYLDYAASAPLRPEALNAMRAYDEAPYAGANPNSLHTLGRSAARALDGARADLARCLGGGLRPSDVIFTSGGTESNNLAVIGLAEGARARSSRRSTVVLSAIEHDSVLDLAPALRGRGFEVRLARPDATGVVRPTELEALLDDTCALVSVMYANNETGAVQPVPELARAAHRAGAVFHTDAVQAFGHVPLELADVDAVSVAAHKLGGPVGVGALAVRGRVPLRPLTLGGGQERGLRAGTQDVRGALAFAAVARALCAGLEPTRAAVSGRARALVARACLPGSGVTPTLADDATDRLPGIVSLLVDGLDSETLVLALDQEGFEVSAASACSSGSLDASHVLTAMGIPRDRALGSLRVSFDERVPQEDLDRFADALLRIVADRAGARRR
ncbi:MAG TPA: cysteine desulfurase [Candidatus Olsenella avicola]|uniref:cysteine desulfurase family protein n=1 Tax=Olsenella sp. An285 TaxID=1965621 RepID=UPI000B394160|nr:cysteine desulfurase family protein [Olsenella sp. An285]OUO46473.1 aminotransferase [Olsenella sp. An285]HIY50805.1 cysteine desulfurase [Candidatus Olsenella avicola]